MLFDFFRRRGEPLFSYDMFFKYNYTLEIKESLKNTHSNKNSPY